MTWRSELLQTDKLLTNDCLAQSLFLLRADSGTFSVPGRVSSGRGTNRLDSGTSRAIRDVWQPYYDIGYGTTSYSVILTGTMSS